MTPYSVFRHDDCYLYGKKYNGSNLNKINEICSDKTDTPHQCQNLCQKTHHCKQFSWYENDFDKRGKECCLKSKDNAKIIAVIKPGVVSGPKFCGK